MYLFTLQLPSDWVGLGRTGWEMQVTDSEEMEKKKKKYKVVLLAWLLILMDTNYMALLCFALLCSN